MPYLLSMRLIRGATIGAKSVISKMTSKKVWENLDCEVLNM